MARKKVDTVEEVVGNIAASIDFDTENDIEIVEDEGIKQENIGVGVEKENLVIVPKMDSPDWTPWVLSQFESSELEDGRPKVNGLRRMVHKLLGPIVEGTVRTVQWPTIENEGRSTVEYTVVIKRMKNLGQHDLPYLMTFSDVADAYRGNVKGLEFARFTPALASTRAQVRALRMALNFGIVGSDELTDQPLEEAGFSSQISESQITKIDIKCQQLDIDLVKFINMNKKKYSKIEDVSNQTAVKMFAEINQYQQEAKAIPDGIKGYNPNWRGEF